MRKLYTLRLDKKTLDRLAKIQGSKTEFVEKAIIARLTWFERKAAMEKSEGDPKIAAIIEAAQKKWNEKKGS